jgi:phosphoglycerate kinase
VPEYLESYAGFWLQKEIENLSKVLKEPAKPFLFILGGAKFETKIDLIKKFSIIADEVFIGGALANNFFQMIVFKVGKYLIDKKADVREFFNKDNIKIPFDVVVKSGGAKGLGEVSDDDMIVDAGPNTLAELKKIIPTFATILWNGPLGLYEEGFDVASKEILKAIAETNSFSVIGGGDTVELVKDLRLEDKISFISTGGGAMLEFLIKGTLPGIEALEQN